MRLATGMLTAALAWAAGIDPRPAATDYPAHARGDAVSLGAEYMVRSLSARNQTFVVNDYLVVEVGLYPAQGRRLLVSSGHFTLRVNGKKEVLFPQTPGMVAASMKYPDWERRPELVAGGGVGGVDVMIGGNPQVERFPGDPRPRQTRLPAPPRAPSGKPEPEQEAAPRAEELISESALPEGETSQPVAGYLYFAYRGKIKAIRSLELIYNGPAGEFSLRLI